jgi:membrane protein YdbS with pleckstrin-like domain
MAAMPDYIDTMLSESETIELKARQHPIALVRFALQPLVILGAALLGLLIGSWINPSGDGIIDRLIAIFDTIVGLITLGLFIVAAVWIPVQVVRWTTRRYVVTNRRVLYAEGLLRRMSVDAGLEKITDVAFRQGWLGRQLGFGDLAITTAAGAPLEFREIVGAMDFKKAVTDGQEALVRERAGMIMAATTGAAGVTATTPASARVVSPPPAAAPAPTPQAAAPELEPAPRVETPEEVTETLARLSQLRDEGAITDEDYEAKKADLLDRL